MLLFADSRATVRAGVPGHGRHRDGGPGHRNHRQHQVCQVSLQPRYGISYFRLATTTVVGAGFQKF